MDVVTISPKFQVVIPRDIRERLKLAPGQKVQAFVYQNRIEFIPVRSAGHSIEHLRRPGNGNGADRSTPF